MCNFQKYDFTRGRWTTSSELIEMLEHENKAPKIFPKLQEIDLTLVDPSISFSLVDTGTSFSLVDISTHSH